MLGLIFFVMMPSFTLNVSCRDQSRFFFSFAEAGRHIWPGSKTVYRQQLSCKRFKLTDYTFQRGPRPKSFLYPPFYGTSKWLKHLGFCTGPLSSQYGLKFYPRIVILAATLCSPLSGSPITTSSFHPTLSKALFITSGLQEV